MSSLGGLSAARLERLGAVMRRAVERREVAGFVILRLARSSR